MDDRTEAERIRELVREKYGQVATAGVVGGGCCGDGGCGCGPAPGASFADSYAGLEGYAPEADLGLGCGLPTQGALIRAGDTVLDLGSGAGNDVFVARALVGAGGRVIGVDMVPAMIAKAQANAARLGAANVEFRLGEIESLPVADASVDVVISNCVLNLVPDKARAFAEIRRVLRPGGRFSVSDIVLHGELPDAVRADAAAYAGCIAGALPETEYLVLLAAAGLVDLAVPGRRRIELPEELVARVLTPRQRDELRAAGTGLYSLTVTGRRPERE